MKFKKAFSFFQKEETYKSLLCKSIGKIKASYKKALKNSAYFSAGYSYIYDNYHVLIRSFEECNCVEFAKAKEIPPLFTHIYNFLSENEFSVSEEDFFAFLKSFGENHYLTYKDLFGLSSLIGASCIYEAGRICEVDIQESDDVNLRILPAVISLLREKENWDFENFISKLSKTEKTFLKYEPYFNKMDNLTKNKYRETFSAFCDSQNIHEKDASPLLSVYCEEKGVNIGELLFKEDKLPALLFFSLSAIFTVLTTAFSFLLLGWFGALLSVPAVLVTAMNFSDMVMSASETPQPCPRLELDSIPTEAKTAVVISNLILSKEENQNIAYNLERFYLLNMEENLYFTVLADFPESKTEGISEFDSETMNDLFQRICLLNKKYGNRFTALVRNRVFHEDESLYYGEERKRGAISSLVDLICGEKDVFEYYEGEKDNFIGVKFLFLLDADTGIGFSSVKEAVSCALHPLNVPVFENGRIQKGYGVFQPAVRFGLVHENQTKFQSFITGSGGLNNYESASYDRFQSIFGSGIFCGKGLLNVELYKKIVQPSIPENTVLSHDMPEGNFLRCRLVQDITVTDDAPTNALSYYSRLHRWIRGDVQNLFFLGNNSASSYSSFKILNNILRHITPIFSFVLILLSTFSKNQIKSHWALFFSLLYILFPFLSVIIFAPFRALNKTTVIGRRFYSQVTGVYLENFFRLIYEIALIPYVSFVTADAIFKSLYRMLFSKKRLLEWKTFSQSERSSKNNLFGYFYKLFINVLSGTILLSSGKPFLFPLGILWIITPFILFLMSKRKKTDSQITKEEKETLTFYSRKIWDFFSDNVNENTNFLPPDNVQTAPTDAVAYRTSPTNMGFYLISCLAAFDFGFINLFELEKRIVDSVATIEKLEKWNGHLYNWYDLKTLEILGDHFVSTVDSGNFVTMLVSLKEGLKDVGLSELSERVETLIENTDFAPLYNKRKKLFTIGRNVKNGKMEENCYDLFMSEARTTSYFAVASHFVPEKHWKALGRTLVSEGRFLGMASWSGTMFEYFMPTLFLPIYKNSFSFEALYFAFNQQRKAQISKLWGMSESGFYSFDSELNYQYKAHGVPSLSLKRYPKNEKVLSPYSSFLTLCINRKASLQNLKRFKDEGIFGQYGFYESADFTYGKAIVKSYMSHHMGMSMISSANACFDGIFIRRFMSDLKMDSASDLLKEKIPTNVPVFKNPESETEAARNSLKLFEGMTSVPSADEPKVALLSSGNLDMRICDGGAVGLLYRGIPINETEYTNVKLNHSLAVGFIDSEGSVKYVSPLLIHNETECKHCSFEFDTNHSSHIIAERDFAASVNYSISERGDCFIIETKSNIKRKYSPFIIFEPQMADDRTYYSAKSFSMMKTRIERADNCIFISSENSKFTVCVQCEKKPFSSILSRDNIEKGNLFDLVPEMDFSKDDFSVYPLCFIKAPLVSGGGCKFYIGVGKTKEQSKSATEKGKRYGSSKRKGFSQVDPNFLSKIAAEVLFKKVKYIDKGGFTAIREKLWKHGISGDYPIYALYVKELCKNELIQYFKAYIYSYRAHLKYDLIIFFDEEDFYFRKTEQKLLSLLNKTGGGSLINKSVGIHFLNVKTSKELFDSKEAFTVFKTVSNRIQTENKQITPFPKKAEERQREKTDKYISIEGSGFIFHKDSLTERKPYSYVLSGKNFGSVVTDSSLGFTFSENSRLGKITSYDESPHAENGEKIFAYYENKLYDLCLYSKTFKCKNGVAIYEGEISGIKYSVCTFVSKTKKEKYIILSFSSEGISAAYNFKPLLSETPSSGSVIQCERHEDKRESFCFFYDSHSINRKNVKGFCSAFGTQNTIPFELNKSEEITVFATGQKILFRLGERDFSDEFSDVPKSSIENALAEKTLQEEFSLSFIPKIKFETELFNIDKLFPFLFYQTAASRFYAKTGYYQNGGAFGFRDQLQDCLSLVYSKPNAVRNHILKAATHQYREGDVMHWWHELGSEHIGVRTTCSDDFLWLPYVTAKYIKLTGDAAILKEEIPFLESSVLEAGKNERYEKAVFTEETASLYTHCILALSRGLAKREDGISLMGCCDWNDGFSKMGTEGKGKSLFTSRLLVMAIEAMVPFMNESHVFPFENLLDFPFISDRLTLEKESSITEREIEKNYFINGQYARCVSDDGTVFGVGKTKACGTDILCQTFAVLGGKNEKRSKEALLYAFDKLFDEKTQTLKLFSPPFDKNTESGGYINSYPAYVRENGGQYTHAAVWTSIALIKCGEVEKGLILLEKLSPLSRCTTVQEGAVYKNEPYVLSADVYSEGFGGRGGWSWYTGAASWYSVAVIEHVLGLKFKGTAFIDGGEKYIGAFKCVEVKPIIPYTAKISLGDYTLNVTVKKGKPSVKLDGKEVSFPLIIPPKKSELEVCF